MCYLVMEGPGAGLYLSYRRLKEVRDAPLENGENGGKSWRAAWFWSMEEAKNYVQAVAV